MSAPFESLEDKLLRGGIAPRHVKRYLRELDEHLSDLAEAQVMAGHDAVTAAATARAALGPDDELAAAMLKQCGLRSLVARFPWLVFGVLPVLALVATLAYLLLLVAFPALAKLVVFSANFILVPAIALLFASIAWRQRLSLAWPILSTAIILILSPHWDNQPIANLSPGFSAFYLAYRYSDDAVRSGFTPLFMSAWRQMIGMQWAAFIVQYLLIMLPFAWLVRRHRNFGAIA